MNSYDYVIGKIPELKSTFALIEAAWELAKLVVGWPYIFGDRGNYCTPSHRQAVYNKHGGDTLISKCQVLNKSKSDCNGCKWFPGGCKVLGFDCRGFTYWILLKIFGWELYGSGCTKQWNTSSNWKAKGTIDTIPEDQLVCLFQYDAKKNNMAHTGFGYKGETIECQVGVQYKKKREKKWTHWGIPICIDGPVPSGGDQGGSTVWNPTLRKGSRGEEVKKAQQLLIDKGYDLGKYGADGAFGAATLAAVKKFQEANGLTVDGVIGPMTWEALEKHTGPTTLYTVHIPHMTEYQADGLIKAYAGSWQTAEGGEENA